MLRNAVEVFINRYQKNQRFLHDRNPLNASGLLQVKQNTASLLLRFSTAAAAFLLGPRHAFHTTYSQAF